MISFILATKRMQALFISTCVVVFAAQANASLKLVRVLSIHSSVKDILFTNRGRSLIAVGGDDSSHGKPFRVMTKWDAQTGRLLWSRSGINTITSLAMSPNRNVLATASGEHYVQLTALGKTSVPIVIQCPIDSIQSVAFSPDGKILACAGQYISLWDMIKKHWVGVLRNKRADRELGQLAFSPTGKYLAAGYNFNMSENTGDGEILIWNIAKKSIAHRLREATCTGCLTFSPDGRVLADGLQYQNDAETTGAIRLWNTKTWGTSAELMPKTDDADLAQICFSPDGRYLATGSSTSGYDDPPVVGQVRIWDVRHRKQIALLTGHRALVETVQFSPNGRLLASGSDDGTVRIWSKR